MTQKTVLVCPKCGSKNIEWHNKGNDDFKICMACGHARVFNEEIVDDAGEEIGY